MRPYGYYRLDMLNAAALGVSGGRSALGSQFQRKKTARASFCSRWLANWLAEEGLRNDRLTGSYR
jgi:hypothetical protein